MACLQEMILERVRDDAVVRTKISQSSALRKKRGNPVVIPEACSTKPEAPFGVNNNGPVSDKNGFVHSSEATTEHVFDKMKEPKDTDDLEEKSVSTESLSELSKFESLFNFPFLLRKVSV